MDKKKIQEIYENTRNIYDTIDDFWDLLPKRPCLENPPKLAKKDCSTSAFKYANELVSWEIVNSDFREKEMEWIKIKYQMEDDMKGFLFTILELEHLPEWQKDKLYDIAYQRGHSSGYKDVFYELQVLSDLFIN